MINEQLHKTPVALDRVKHRALKLDRSANDMNRLTLLNAFFVSVGEFAEAVGITPANLAVLKNGRAKAVRFTTLDAICRTLECQPGDILRWVPSDEP